MVAPPGRIFWLVGIVGATLAAGAWPTFGAETASLERAKEDGRTGSRLVGVSCICYPARASMAEMEARIDLDSQIVHIDYNADRVRRLKEAYGPQVKVETASPEAVYFLSSLHPDRSIEQMIEEFEIETLDDYLDRSREVRKQNLPEGG